MDNITKDVVESVRKATQEAKKEASAKILALINEFEENTGTRVTSINLSREWVIGYSDEGRLDEKVTLQVSV